MEKYQGALALAARVLLSAVMFCAALFNLLNWSHQVTLLTNLQTPLPELSLAVATGVEIVLGLPLLVGFQTRWAAGLLAAYLVICAFALHPFWSTPPAERGHETVQFFESLGVVGGLLMIVAFGPGRLSIDAARSGAHVQE